MPSSPIWARIVTGRLYSSHLAAGAVTTLAVSANTLYATPIFVATSTTLTTIGIEVTTGATGNVRLGIYYDTAGSPAALPQTAVDIPGEHYHGLVVPDWPVMIGPGERVRYVGDALAIVAAETREIAIQAVELIEVEFDAQPVITGPVQARGEDAPRLHPKGNVLKHIQVRKGDVSLGFAAADIILEHTFHTPIIEHAFIEPECSIARPTANGRMEIYVGCRSPTLTATRLLALLAGRMSGCGLPGS